MAARDLFTGETALEMIARDHQDQQDFDTYHATWQDAGMLGGALVVVLVGMGVMDWWQDQGGPHGTG